MKLKDIYSQYANYIVIFLVSVAFLTVFPLMGSHISLGVMLKTKQDWIMFILQNILASALNMTLFASFVNQGKVDVKNDPKYLEAMEILKVYRKNNKEYIPTSPKKHYAQIYGTKGTFLVISTVISTFLVASIIINFSLILFISYCLTIIIGIIFGVRSQLKEQIYWTDGILEFAYFVRDEAIKKQNNEKVSQKLESSEEEVAQKAEGDNLC